MQAAGDQRVLGLAGQQVRVELQKATAVKRGINREFVMGVKRGPNSVAARAASLTLAPQKSNRQHAKQLKVDHKTVAGVRGDLELIGEIPPN